MIKKLSLTEYSLFLLRFLFFSFLLRIKVEITKFCYHDLKNSFVEGQHIFLGLINLTPIKETLRENFKVDSPF